MTPATQRASTVLIVLTVAAAAALVSAILCGGSGCFWPGQTSDILWQLRVPRALSGFAVGGLLALAGALLQLLLRNPLADPYVLGVSGGAATGAMALCWLAPAAMAGYSMQLGALAGALLATALLFGLARRALNGLSPALAASPSGVRLILTGVMLSAGFGALMSLLLTLSPDGQLRGMLFWLMGDLDTGALVWPAWLVLIATALWSVLNASQLNVLAHGETTAQLLGLPVRRLRATTLLVASLATASAVAIAGAIGFVGLVVPHAVRLVTGNDQRLLLPASVLAGGAALTLADLLARSIAAPVQLPVGVITALIGVPVFLALLARSR
jgi:iron complex transport system permease protein